MNLLQSFKNYLDLRQIPYRVEDSIVFFAKDEWNLMLLYDNDFPSYFRLALPRLDIVDNTFGIEKYKRALQIAGEYKIVKAAIIEDNLWFLFENFLSDYDYSHAKLYERAIGVLLIVGNKWRRVD